MGDFKKFGKKGDTWSRGPGGKPSFNSRPGFNRGLPERVRSQSGGDERREMFKATCAECGKPCEVPFRPSGDRPVYCRDCFAAMGPQNRDDRPARGPSPSAPRRDFAPRPSYTQPSQGSGEDKRLDDLKIQLATVISKLDKLLNIVGNTAHTTPKVTSSAKPETLHDTIATVVPSAVPKKESLKSKSAAPSTKKKLSSKKK